MKCRLERPLPCLATSTITPMLMFLFGLATTAIAAQAANLPQGSTVSALGRTALVRSDGSFTISGVPANAGRFRVRLVHPDGRKAQSECLTPVLRGITIVPPLDFTNF